MRLRMCTLIVLALTSLGACGGSNSDDGDEASGNGAPSSSSTSVAPSTFDVSGTLTLTSGSVAPEGLSECIVESEELMAEDCDPTQGSNCDGSDGYGDIATGAQVTVNDNAGATVAIGELGQGTLAEDAPGWSFGEPFVCDFPIVVTGVPDSGDIYSVSVASRDPFSFSKEESGDLALTLSD